MHFYIVSRLKNWSNYNIIAFYFLLPGPLYIGGADQSSNLPSVVDSFQGCLMNVQITENRSSRLVDFSLFSPNLRGHMDPNCLSSADRCPSYGSPCNRGRCLNQPGGWICDCRGTGAVGDRCQRYSKNLNSDIEVKISIAWVWIRCIISFIPSITPIICYVNNVT